MQRAFKRFLKDKVLYNSFRFGQRLGVDILPRHFYSEIPDLQALRRSEAWKRPYARAVHGWAELSDQLAFAEQFLGHCNEDVVAMHRNACARAGEQGFGQVETAALHSFVLTLQPPTIIQIGCGVSTAVILKAAEERQYSPRIACVEPYPSRFLQECEADGKVILWRTPAQEALSELIAEIHGMPTGSLLFVDSSHTLGPAGECTRLICEVLPKMRSGTYAHFHDIKFPYDYPRRMLNGELFFQHESALLMAFLTCNNRFRIEASLSMLHYANRAALAEICSGYEPARDDEGIELAEGHFPSSCYIKCIAD